MDKDKNQSRENLDENMDKGFTVKEVATYLEETPNVIRNWFKELRKYVPHEKNSNGYNIYKQEGIERFKEIQSLHRGVASGKCGYTTLSKLEHRKIGSFTTCRNRFFDFAYSTKAPFN